MSASKHNSTNTSFTKQCVKIECTSGAFISLTFLAHLPAGSCGACGFQPSPSLGEHVERELREGRQHDVRLANELVLHPHVGHGDHEAPAERPRGALVSRAPVLGDGGSPVLVLSASTTHIRADKRVFVFGLCLVCVCNGIATGSGDMRGVA